ncbi:MAG TPA: NrfD/PsrC family molybdoenzyme membrane anchor subunit [Thermoanaerobaculia bacterium]|nr:NrfD/PsrC family molybdoenzyme membrane anchor subunit [Thermoanaerobaculia bacterium]
MTEIELLRNNHLIDPTLHVWGWEIPVYLFLGGLAAGLMILSAIAGRSEDGPDRTLTRALPFLAPALLSAGMLALMLDLEAKVNVFRFYLVFRPASPMSWGAWILLLIFPATLLLGIARLTSDEWSALLARVSRLASPLTRIRDAAIEREGALRIANTALGIALGTYTGVLLGTLGARALWSSPLLGPLFLASGLSSAAALVMLLAHRDGALAAKARRWDLAAIGAEAALLALFFVGLASGTAGGRAAFDAFFGGTYTAAFVSLVFVPGIVLPAAMEGGHRGAHAGSRVAPVLVLLGGLALRWIFVAAGQSI